SLDAFLQARIARMMRTLAIDAGASMLFISHDLAVVREIADRVAAMEAGRSAEVGTTEQIWTDPQHAYTKPLLAATPKVGGAAILFSSADLAVVRESADRVAAMEAGRTVEVGTTEQIWNDPQHAYTKKLLAAIPKVDGKGIIPG